MNLTDLKSKIKEKEQKTNTFKIRSGVYLVASLLLLALFCSDTSYLIVSNFVEKVADLTSGMFSPFSLEFFLYVVAFFGVLITLELIVSTLMLVLSMVNELDLIKFLEEVLCDPTATKDTKNYAALAFLKKAGVGKKLLITKDAAQPDVIKINLRYNPIPDQDLDLTTFFSTQRSLNLILKLNAYSYILSLMLVLIINPHRTLISLVGLHALGWAVLSVGMMTLLTKWSSTKINADATYAVCFSKALELLKANAGTQSVSEFNAEMHSLFENKKLKDNYSEYDIPDVNVISTDDYLVTKFFKRLSMKDPSFKIENIDLTLYGIGLCITACTWLVCFAQAEKGYVPLTAEDIAIAKSKFKNVDSNLSFEFKLKSKPYVIDGVVVNYTGTANKPGACEVVHEKYIHLKFSGINYCVHPLLLPNIQNHYKEMAKLTK